MRKIYHLGLHKTGSTSLQLLLWRNRITLARAAILVPPVTPEGLARLRADLAAARGDLPASRTPVPGLPALNDYMGHNALAYRMITEALPGFHFPPVHAPMPAADAALAGIAELCRDLAPRAAVFCSEDFARAGLMAPAVPRRFAQAFGTDNTVLIASLRRPDEAIAAWRSQMLRFGAPFPALRDLGPGAGLGQVQFEYRAALHPWQRAFPGARWQILPYADLRTQGGSIAAFPALAGLTLPGGMQPVDNANPSLPHALLEIARLGLAALPRPAAGALRRYLEEVPARLALPANDEVELFAPGVRETLYRAFLPIHDWLGQVTGRIPFFEDLQEMRRPRPLHELQAASMILGSLRRDATTHLDNRPARAFLDKLVLPDS